MGSNQRSIAIREVCYSDSAIRDRLLAGPAADMLKPVQVYILLGQSNMLGFGKIDGGDGSLGHAVKEKGLYPYLVNGQGDWVQRDDVRNVRVMGSGTGGMRTFTNEFMTETFMNIGEAMGQAMIELLKD